MTASSLLSVRAARSEDAQILADLATQLGYSADAAQIGDRLARVCADHAGQVMVAVDAQDKVLGWAHVVPRLHLEDAPFAELAGLVVDAGARGRGVGALLLHSAEDWARTRGFAQFRVRSNVLCERAHRFYLREGYAERKRQVVFVKAL
jgi:GNAT superfamily N-acetyltransferase